MVPWHRHRGAGALLRLAGGVLLAGAWFAAKALAASVARRGSATPDAADFALAAVAFLGATGGMVLALLGAHIFDRVALPARWARLEVAYHDVHAEHLRQALRDQEDAVAQSPSPAGEGSGWGSAATVRLRPFPLPRT